jgi:hypothetical protein
MNTGSKRIILIPLIFGIFTIFGKSILALFFGLGINFYLTFFLLFPLIYALIEFIIFFLLSDENLGRKYLYLFIVMFIANIITMQIVFTSMGFITLFSTGIIITFFLETLVIIIEFIIILIWFFQLEDRFKLPDNTEYKFYILVIANIASFAIGSFIYVFFLEVVFQ